MQEARSGKAKQNGFPDRKGAGGITEKMGRCMTDGAKRALRWAIPLILMPLLVILGGWKLGDRFYAWGILGMVILTQALFLTGFERQTVGSRRLVIAAVMTALSVLGRILFAPLPGFKPITAIVVITGVWIGGETGFLVGALSALISNIFSGQGPWTPFQMFAWGMIGLGAGLVSGWLKKSRAALAAYGVFAGVAYSLFMDIWTVLWYNGNLSWPLYTAAVVTALPYMASYAASNVIFLLLLGRPFGQKLERIRIKYGV